MQRYTHFFSSTQPANPSSMSQRYTLDMPPFKVPASRQPVRFRACSALSTTPTVSSRSTHSSLYTSKASFALISIFRDAVARRHALALVHWWLEFVAPRTPPAVAIAVIVAAQEVALRLGALLDSQSGISTDSRRSSVRSGFKLMRWSTFCLTSFGFKRRRRSLWNQH